MLTIAVPEIGTFGPSILKDTEIVQIPTKSG